MTAAISAASFHCCAAVESGWARFGQEKRRRFWRGVRFLSFTSLSAVRPRAEEAEGRTLIVIIGFGFGIAARPNGRATCMATQRIVGVSQTTAVSPSVRSAGYSIGGFISPYCSGFFLKFLAREPNARWTM